MLLSEEGKIRGITTMYERLSMQLRSLYFFPSYIVIEPSAKCNLYCRFCSRSRFSDKEDASYMSNDLFKSVVDQLRDCFLKKVIILSGAGEPFLNPNLISMVRYAKRNKIRVELTTNLTIATEDDLLKLIEMKLDKLVISMDGATKKTYESIRVGGIFENVLRKILFVKKAKQRLGIKKPSIYLNCVIIEGNAQEAHQIVKLAEKLELDGVAFNKPLIPGVKFSEVNIPVLQINELFSSKIKVDVRYLKNNSSRCRVPRSCYITADGKVLPCAEISQLIPRIEYQRYILGDLTIQSFKKIWFSSSYKEFRLRTIKFGQASLPFCKWCSNC